MVGLNENDEKGFGSEGRFLSTDPFDMILDYDQGKEDTATWTQSEAVALVQLATEGRISPADVAARRIGRDIHGDARAMGDKAEETERARWHIDPFNATFMYPDMGANVANDIYSIAKLITTDMSNSPNASKNIFICTVPRTGACYVVSEMTTKGGDDQLNMAMSGFELLKDGEWYTLRCDACKVRLPLQHCLIQVYPVRLIQVHSAEFTQFAAMHRALIRLQDGTEEHFDCDETTRMWFAGLGLLLIGDGADRMVFKLLCTAGSFIGHGVVVARIERLHAHRNNATHIGAQAVLDMCIRTLGQIAPLQDKLRDRMRSAPLLHFTVGRACTLHGYVLAMAPGSLLRVQSENRYMTALIIRDLGEPDKYTVRIGTIERSGEGRKLVLESSDNIKHDAQEVCEQIRELMSTADHGEIRMEVKGHKETYVSLAMLRSQQRHWQHIDDDSSADPLVILQHSMPHDDRMIDPDEERLHQMMEIMDEEERGRFRNAHMKQVQEKRSEGRTLTGGLAAVGTGAAVGAVGTVAGSIATGVGYTLSGAAGILLSPYLIPAAAVVAGSVYLASHNKTAKQWIRSGAEKAAAHTDSKIGIVDAATTAEDQAKLDKRRDDQAGVVVLQAHLNTRSNKLQEYMSQVGMTLMPPSPLTVPPRLHTLIDELSDNGQVDERTSQSVMMSMHTCSHYMAMYELFCSPEKLWSVIQSGAPIREATDVYKDIVDEMATKITSLFSERLAEKASSTAHTDTRPSLKNEQVSPEQPLVLTTDPTGVQSAGRQDFGRVIV